MVSDGRLSLEQSDTGFILKSGASRLLSGAALLRPIVRVGSATKPLDRTLHSQAGDGWVDLWFEIQPQEPVGLCEIEIVSPDSTTTLYEALNIRNRHHTTAIFPDLALGGEVQTTTYSNDWQFAPHPSILLFRKLDLVLAIGALTPHQGFGLYLEADHYTIKRLSLDMGGAEFPLPLEAGQTWVSPKFRFLLSEDPNPYTALDRFFPPTEPTQHCEWAADPLYCTWFDQVFRAESLIPSGLDEQLGDSSWDACTAAMTEELVRESVEVIRRERLPIKTVLLDVGWFKAIGQWEVDEAKFPNMRQLVDDLHAQGLKVIVWWHWGDLNDDAEADDRFLMGAGWRTRHGKRIFDYSSPATQTVYLPELFHKHFSSDQGCYDFDGVKTDFLADKIHPEMPLFDSAWRGEENYFERVTELFFNEMRRHKPDSAHIGASGHPALSPYIDANRTYDVHSTNPYEHLSRAEMLRHTCPGVPVAFDFHPYLENLDLYFELAKQSGSGVQIGNLLYTRTDPLAPGLPADEAYWERLRAGLATVNPS